MFKGNPKTIKIDLYSMAIGQIISPFKLKKMTKKQKQSVKSNHFTLGFDVGFTKPLLKELYRSRSDSNYKSDIASKLLFKKYEVKKKKSNKKKSFQIKCSILEQKTIFSILHRKIEWCLDI